jgi:transposase-like protein
VDGLKGFHVAIEAVYPRAAVHLCIVHMVRHSLNYVSWKMRKDPTGRSPSTPKREVSGVPDAL